MRRRSFMMCALAVASTLLVSCIIPAFEADCPEATGTSCGECLESSGCGWCRDDSTCLPGTAYGADEGRCSTNGWRFGSCDEVSRACNDDCYKSNDGYCDEPTLCDPGTDCTDCR